MQTPTAEIVFRLLAILGGLVALVLFSTPFFLPRLLPPGFLLPTETNTTTSVLGELGSRCGGPALLPCKPGLVCSQNTREGAGVCVAGTSTAR